MVLALLAVERAVGLAQRISRTSRHLAIRPMPVDTPIRRSACAPSGRSEPIASLIRELTRSTVSLTTNVYEHDREFVSAEPRRSVTLRGRHASDDAGHESQRVVARGVAAAIVDGFEAVEIEIEQRADQRPVSLRATLRDRGD